GLNEREINFDAIEANNIASADANGNGNFGDSYLRRSSVNNHNWYGLLSNLNIEANENWSLNVGIDTRLYRGDHFRQLNETFGLNGYVDNFRTDRPDGYVISDTFEANPWSALFDFADEGQRYDRDYSENINYIGGFGQAEYAKDGFSAFFQGALSTQSYQREGRLSGVGDGLGKSEKINKTGYQVKGGLGYEIDDKHAIFGNVGLFSRQPFLDNVFANIRYSNALVQPDVENEEILGFEAGYRFKNKNFRFNLDVYNTEWGNRFLNVNGPIQVNDDPSTYRLTDVTQVHRGVEFDLEYRPDSRAWSFRSYGSVGNWKYDGATPYTLQNVETGDFIVTDGNVDLTGVKVGNAPQTSFGVGFRADICEGLSVDMDYNIYSDLYEFVDPQDVADEALNGGQYESVRLPSYTLADAGLTYRFSLGDNPLTFRANVFNVFNSAYINQRDAFGYFLGVGRTFNASLRYNF
ncbi:TonB-dependent receptor, partial [Winogradskyella sp.]|nr:TonB-dependent receptor [Winogradskyella sp.]